MGDFCIMPPMQTRLEESDLVAGVLRTIPVPRSHIQYLGVER